MTRPLEYKGYQAEVSFEDDRLVIHVLHVSDHLVAECTDATKAKAAFESLIEDYLADCADIGKEPEKPFKGSFNVRVSPDLHRRCAKRAAALGVTLNELVGQALEAYVESPSLRAQEEEWSDMFLHLEHIVGRIEPLPVLATSEAFVPYRRKAKKPEGLASALQWNKMEPLRQ